MPMTLNRMFEKKQAAFGPFLKLPNPALVEIIGIAGFDFVIIDCEHGPLDMLVAEEMVRAAKLSGLSAVIRVSENNPALISRALDIGADAVQVPQVSTRTDAEKVVQAAKFAPLGERGVCRYVRAAGYSSVDRQAYFTLANQNTRTIIHIEGEEGMENIQDILQVEGIDVIFIGPYDLSQSLGLPGQVDHPLVVARMREIIDRAREAGKIVGTFVDDVDAARKWLALGVQYIAYSVDTGIIYQSFKEIADSLYQGVGDEGNA